ncbi:MAG: bifunctional DNA-formamidopyrimidine glycosylase/DNA-(apurinic or apyrimidinic site) lyase [Gammaproteobacteria bacterium]|jgi:formamidopyrimidine-DNA glycosylase|nr:bifunctional DNA-formamidopyrimidine glycosylase/DNA-(apurinic or apyrimidinic site) lyase [Gammaproteobacteria bacterium]MBT5204238.1 bifunctional DNA-formamidopyrimidine glycosylase/DNA-(apurinic or apyrimidinic site) lyase [Gammaproteobacteria bacterium]MBT5602549.1 bifunctional DNA-formamidopyrimidine glycosylase/DNA-(apurinic or apyrimidinic site) lyase [Gammaproteobacteria bacterium]MBT6246057.1 bifunctional DNA-formamidopyrimidine glycosylase/DNA-(apurinic or apyrimidinic site) lyase [
MPELPEVETTRAGIEPHIKGQRIDAVHVREYQLRWPISPGLGQSVTGKVVREVKRRAKYLLLDTHEGQIMLHLGMSGSLRILSEQIEAQAHDHVDFLFSNGKLLRYRDPRKFGSIFWLPDDEHKLLNHLGPEPLLEEFTPSYLFAQCRGRKVAIKTLIMNAQIVVGVGNIYANEALFSAGIRPTFPAGKLSLNRCTRLVEAIRVVLGKAIAAGGTSLRDFSKEDGTPGYFRQALQVYGRDGEDCYFCQKPLKAVRLGGRATVYCSRCQR